MLRARAVASHPPGCIRTTIAPWLICPGPASRPTSPCGRGGSSVTPPTAPAASSPNGSPASPHRTDRLRDWLVHTAFALGGKPGARLLRQLGIPVCGSTLLSYLRAQTLPAGPTPRIRILSFDDFAFRRGCTYGSILVDLERHQVIDLLPDRSGTGFAAWLTAHPGVELLRD